MYNALATDSSKQNCPLHPGVSVSFILNHFAWKLKPDSLKSTRQDKWI